MKEILRREWSILWHGRRIVLFVLMVAASAYATLVGNLYQHQIVENIPVAVCDLDASDLSRQLEADVADANQYRLVGETGELPEAEAWLKSHRAAAVVVIPRGFADDFYSGRHVTLGFLQDGTNTLVAGYASAPMTYIAAYWSAKYRETAAMMHGTPELPAASVSLGVRNLGNPTQSYLAFYTYGVMLMAAQIGMMMAYALSVQGDARKTYYRKHGFLKVTFAKGMFYWLLSFLSVLLGILLLAMVFRLPFHGSWLQILAICAVFLFAVEGLVGLPALFFRTKLALVQCLVFYSLPAFLAAGYIWPEEGMIGLVQWLSVLQPVHYSMIDFRQLAMTGTAAAYGRHVLVLLSMGVVGHILTVAGLKRIADQQYRKKAQVMVARGK